MNRIDLTIRLQSLSSAGLAMPPEVQKRLDALEALGNVPEQLDPLDGVPAVTEQNAAKAIAKVAQALASQQYARDASRLLERPLVDELAAHAAAAVPAWMSTLREEFARPAAVIHEAADRFDDYGIRESANHTHSPEDADLLARYRQADAELNIYRAARIALGAFGGGGTEPLADWFVTGAVTTEDRERAYIAFNDRSGHLWHRLVSRGFTLTLNPIGDPDAYGRAAAEGDARAQWAAIEKRREEAAAEPTHKLYRQALENAGITADQS